LSHIRWLFVIARNSSFTYKGQAIAGQRLHITAQLIDAVADAHLWADRFDGSLEDVFDLQDQVAISVAGVIEPTFQAAEIRRSSHRPTHDLTAYDLYLRALALTFSWEKDAIIRALDLLERAIERDPGYGAALAQAARCHQDLHVSTGPTTRRRAAAEARISLGEHFRPPVTIRMSSAMLATRSVTSARKSMSRLAYSTAP
jgi:hypothetical protein